jgi:predicted lipid-binding transport protein (Tim44 family)
MKVWPEGRSANEESAMPVDDKRSEDKTLTESVRAEDITDAELVSEALAERPAETASPAPARRRGGGAFLGTVLGGILAAGAGFGLARMVPGGWPIQDISALEAQIKTQADSLAAMTAQLADLAARPVQDASAEIAALRAELQASIADSPDVIDPAPMIAKASQESQAAIAALDSRLTEIETRPVGAGGDRGL